jgi:hypothetical protein
MTACTDDGQSGGFGSRFVVAPGTRVPVKVRVAGGAGGSLRVISNGAEQAVVPVDDDEFEYDFAATRSASEGPLGTWWRVETFDSRSRTTIGNPLFLGGATRGIPSSPPSLRVRCRLGRNLAGLRSRRSLPQRPEIGGGQ